jgi:hypothetical protein
LALQLEEGTQVDLPIKKLHDSKQMAFMVDVKQVTVVCQAIKPKAKSGEKKNKASKGYFQAFEKSYFFHSIFTIGLFSKWVFHHLLLTNKCKNTHMLLLHFYFMTKVQNLK